MSAWDIDDDESHETSGTAGRVGAEYYSIVIHYRGAQLKQLIPHHVRRNDRGEPIKSQYKKTENQTEEGTPETVKEDKVEKWSTKKDVLDNMQSESKQACNAVKTFLIKSGVLLWYHNGQQDECSTFPGVVHWHVILHSEQGASGNFKYLHDVSVFRTMKLKCQAAGGYVRVQAVRCLPGIISHFNTKPRLFLGCNHRSLYKSWQLSLEKPVLGAMAEFVEELEGEEEAFNSKTEKRYSTWDDEGPIAKKGGWECDEDQFVLPAASKVAVVVKETPTDAYVRLLRILMTRYRVNNMSEMFHAIGKLPKDVDETYKALWYRLSGKNGIQKHMETCLNYLKCDNQTKTFSRLVEEFCTSPDILSSNDYETPEMSYKFFLKWCKKQHIDVGEIVTNTMDVLDKTLQKVNSICFTGPSNSGKTVMYSQPISQIMRFVGNIGNRGSDSPFIYQECVNCSLICIDECVMDPANYEDLKLLLGGEKMKVAVKHLGHATITRTPVILTGNKEPWVLDYSAKDAMLSRMFWYQVQKDDDLKEVKHMHPGMWWYLRQQYQNLEKLKPISKLLPYPLMTPESPEAVDPLD